MADQPECTFHQHVYGHEYCDECGDCEAAVEARELEVTLRKLSKKDLRKKVIELFQQIDSASFNESRLVDQVKHLNECIAHLNYRLNRASNTEGALLEKIRAYEDAVKHIITDLPEQLEHLKKAYHLEIRAT